MSMTETLLARGVGEDALGDVGNTPLIKAAREGHDGVVSRLLAAGADVFIENGLGVITRLWSWRFNMVTFGVLKVLFQHGMTANDVFTTEKLTALTFAAEYDQAAVVDLLVDKGADIERGKERHFVVTALSTRVCEPCVPSLITGQP